MRLCLLPKLQKKKPLAKESVAQWLPWVLRALLKVALWHWLVSCGSRFDCSQTLHRGSPCPNHIHSTHQVGVLNLYGYVALSQSTSFLTVRTFEVCNNPQVYGSELFLGFICGIPKQMSSSYGAWEPCWKESTLYKEQVFWEVLVVCR